ncbi:MAG TPA: sigma-54 dependent transcriptional regulator [Candidatus Binatia bacterium]|nr:sigma-54 dependent transcriptional regulator [Candidatus Binatia bacterium]
MSTTGAKPADKPRILIVDDEPEFCRFLEDCLGQDEYAITSVHDGDAALEALGRGFDLVLTDFQMTGLSGMDVIAGVRAADASVPVILITAFGTIEQAVEAMRTGAYDYVTKPVSITELRSRVRRALETHELRSQVARLEALAGERSAIDGIVAHSKGMRRVVETVRQLERSRSNVLLTGESGTGKELVARALHRYSPVSTGPFVPVNCAAIPEQLLESELFGHVRGAFTDARADRAGLFEIASGGTIFLDEIGEMSSVLQAKLLRVLEDGTVRRVGSATTETVSVRVVSATNRNLETEVTAGRFRADLFYRLNVVEIRIPPLRDRPEDVAALIAHFLQEIGGGTRKLSEQARMTLLGYAWPGNVRQLRNAIDHALSLSSNETIEVEDLPEALRRHAAEAGGHIPSMPDAEMAGLTLAELEQRHIMQVLERTGGNRSAAAALLGIDRKTLYKRLRREPS